MTTLACRSLDLTIGDTNVVRNLQLELGCGEFWGLMGANGIGKTTLMSILAGLSEPDSGTVHINDQALHDLDRRDVARQLGMMQQHTNFVFESTVLQAALMGRHPHLSRWQNEQHEDVEIARNALATVEMAGLEQRVVTQLSGGESRRLAFATLLTQQPDILLLDEPSNHLDLKHQVRIMSAIGEQVYSDSKLAIAAMHDINLAACYCSHVLMLFGDGEWSAGPAAQMFSKDNLERLYQCPVQMVDTPDGMRFHPSFSDSPS